ncbi:UDP-N-acetylmuramoyl-L-alanine--D-glutamate ligase [bacterium]|nr:UDP-N-acetylmuramoyl-L-alanine--D-glutamate ligase [bacterium]
MVYTEGFLTQKWRQFCAHFGLPERPTILVVGLERTGLSVCSFLSQFDCFLLVTDKNDSPSLRQKLQSLSRANIRSELGRHRAEMFNQADCIVVSPGVPLSLEYFNGPRRRGIPIINDIELSYHFCSCSMVGITGSNGKTTVSDLTGRILAKRTAGCTVAGNIGLPVLDMVPFDQSAEHALVLELSSFQLESVIRFRPLIGVLLNLTPDHLDRYACVEDYYRAKMRLFLNQTEQEWAVLNHDDQNVRAWAEHIKARKVWFSLSEPQEYGIWLRDDTLMSSIDGPAQALFSLDRLQLIGLHNRLNVLAATGVGLLLGVGPEHIARTIEHYQGLAHRFEKVAVFQERVFINDSKATNIGAVEAALRGHTHGIQLILGGRNKGGDFGDLKTQIAAKVEALYLIGEASSEIETMLRDVCPMHLCDSLGAAVWKAYRESRPGQTILLSPGCASFDMFHNYEHRGDTFKEIVRQLIESERHRVQDFSL